MMSDQSRSSAITIIAIFCTIAGGWGIGLGILWLARSFGLSKNIAVTIAGIATPIIIIAGWMILFPRINRRGIHADRRAEGENICLGCGYDRTGLPADRPCPECGEAAPVSGNVPAS